LLIGTDTILHRHHGKRGDQNEKMPTVHFEKLGGRGLNRTLIKLSLCLLGEKKFAYLLKTFTALRSKLATARHL